MAVSTMTPQRQQLAAILGMMGSAHDGEVANAARHAERLRKQMGATWTDLLTPATKPERRPAVGYYVVVHIPSRAWHGFYIPYAEDRSLLGLTASQAAQHLQALQIEIVQAFEQNDIATMNNAASQIWLLTGHTFFCIDAEFREGRLDIQYQAHRHEGIQDAIQLAQNLLPVAYLEMMEQEEAEESVG